MKQLCSRIVSVSTLLVLLKRGVTYSAVKLIYKKYLLGMPALCRFKLYKDPPNRNFSGIVTSQIFKPTLRLPQGMSFICTSLKNLLM